MNREILELREVIAKLVPLLTGKGLQVTQRGSQAYVKTDPKTKRPIVVNIPSISDNASPEFIRAIQGYIDHEVAHVLLTDWNYYAGGESDPSKIMTREYQQFQNTHNIVEDTMIEREIVKIFPGSRKNIADLREMFIKDISLPAIKKAKSPKEAFIYILVPLMRALAGHEEFIQMMDDHKLWDNEYCQGVVKGLKPATLQLLKDCGTTKETLGIARELHEILYPPAPPATPPAPSPMPAAPPPPATPPAPEPEEDEKDEGESEDKPEKEAGEGEGTGERDHKDKADAEDEADEGKPGAGDGEDDDAGNSDGDDGDEADSADANDSEGSDEGADDGEDGAGSATGGDVDLDDDADDASGDAGGSAGSDAAGDPGADDEGDDGAEDGDAGSAGHGVVGHDLDADETTGIGKGDEDENESKGGGVGSGEDGATKSIFDFEEDAFDEVDMASAIAVMISEDAVEAMNRSDYNVYSREFDRIEPAPVPPSMNGTWVPKMEEQIKSMVGRLQKDIERIMASQSHVIRTPGHRRGKLHAPSLFRVTQGDDRVFSVKEEHVSKDTAVMLLIDNSGSMHGSKMRTAMLSGYALSSTLDRVNIAHEVIGFTTGDWGDTPQSVLEAMSDEVHKTGVDYHRVIPLMMPIYKSFDERVSPTVKQRIAYAANAQMGLAGNIDGECLEYAAARLMKRREKRKVMIVFSDGQPAGRQAGPHLKAVVRDLSDKKKFGIDMIGIGIEDNSVRHYYPNHVVLNDVEQLPGQVMGELKKLLI